MRFPIFLSSAACLGAALLLALLPSCSGGLSAGGAQPAKPTGPPVVVQFTTSNSSGVAAGQAATLTWHVTGAETISISPGVGQVTGSSVTVAPLSTTTYTLTAANGLGRDTATCTVIVDPAGEGILSIVANLPAPGPADGTGTGARFEGPGPATVDGAGNIYLVDQGGSAIRMVTPAGAVTTLASGLSPAVTDLASGPRGVLYLLQGSAVMSMVAGGTPSVVAGGVSQGGYADGVGGAAQFLTPQGIAVDASGNVFVADTGNNLVRMIDPAGNVSSLAGAQGQAGNTDGVGTSAQFGTLAAITVDGTGNIYVVDQSNESVRKVDVEGNVATVATGLQLPGGLAAAQRGGLFGAAASAILAFDLGSGQTSVLAGSTGEPGYQDASGDSARFGSLKGLAVAPSGILCAVDAGNGAVRSVTPYGGVTTLAGAPGAGKGSGTGGLAVDAAGNILVASASASAILKVTAAGAVSVLAGQVGLAGSTDGTGTQARFGVPAGLAQDASGNLYVSDRANQVIRKVTAGGAVSTVAGTVGSAGSQDGAQATFNGPAGLAVDASGNVLIADAGNNTLRKLAADGSVTTFAGTAGEAGSRDGTALDAQFNGPQALAVDAKGTIYVADTGNAAIRVVSPSGKVSTLAFSLDGASDGGGSGPLAGPASLALDGTGNLYAIDHLGTGVLKIALSTGLAVWVPQPPGAPSIAYDALVMSGSRIYASGFLGETPVLAKISGL